MTDFHSPPQTISSSTVIKETGKGFVMFICAHSEGADRITLFDSNDFTGAILGHAETSALAPNIVDSYGIKVNYSNGLSALIEGNGTSQFTIFTWPTQASPGGG